MYRVNEIFSSIQGEGMWTGMPSTFIRLQGCTVGCMWCDTKYTWLRGEGQEMSAEDILKEVHNIFVVITGGEPTIQNLDELLSALSAKGYYTAMETSGQNELMGVLKPHWVTWSPKYRLNYNAPTTIKEMASEVKWVIDVTLDFQTIMDTWNWYADRPKLPPNFILMPEGSPPREDLVKKALEFLNLAKDVYNISRKGMMSWRVMDRAQYRFGVK